MKKNKYILVFFYLVLLVICGCSTGVDESPVPGTIRITIQGDSSDSLINIANEIYTAGDEDSFLIKFVQGKIYADDLYYILYKNTSTYVQQDLQYNILKRDSISNGTIRYTVFETMVPPGLYDKIQFGLNGSSVVLGNLEIPLVLPDDANLLMDFSGNIEVKENTITEVNFLIKPFQSVQRYRDNFIFVRRLEISSINYVNE